MKRRFVGALGGVAVLSLPASARAEDGPPVEIVVVARRTPPPATLTDSVDTKTIERFGTTNVGETLERLP